MVAQKRSKSIVCAAARASSVPALAGSLDIQGCVHALHESAHGPRHQFSSPLDQVCSSYRLGSRGYDLK